MSSQEIKILNESVFIDTVLLYNVLRRLTTPFDKTKAYELGIIDERGKVLKKRKELTTSEERAAFTLFDVLIFNLKKIIQRLPFGKSKIANLAAALFLIREEKYTIYHTQDEEILNKCFTGFFESLELENGSEKLLSLLEDVPVNNIGGGAIFGTNPETGVVIKKKKTKVLRRDDENNEETMGRSKKSSKRLKKFSEYTSNQ